MIAARGYAALDASSPLTSYAFERRDVGPKDVLIDIEFCGVCHTDLHQVRGDWNASVYPMVPGHEIVGRVARVGDAVTRHRVGDRVGVGCWVDSCRTCVDCRDGEESYCARAVSTYNGLEPDRTRRTLGGYSDRIVVTEDFVLRVPETLDPAGAAPLLCAGISMYAPLVRFGVRPGMRVGILGFGGLGHLGVKLATSMGAEVVVLSHSTRKRDDALRLGAHAFVTTDDKSAMRALDSSLDVVLSTVSATVDWTRLLRLLRRDGALCLVGVPPTPMEVSAWPLFMGRRTLTGSYVGSLGETQAMLEHCGAQGIESEVEVLDASRVNEAFERLDRGDVRYRFVLDLRSREA